ncbi:hypothetical protein VTN77DRAFT_4967 [Rasamsonia byssochlamydoides]|uniref:uncharacterized protein n=1 Tax=Rasamsonia byssochlamydoides TaxID=89139 RepID=UPI0037425042
MCCHPSISARVVPSTCNIHLMPNSHHFLLSCPTQIETMVRPITDADLGLRVLYDGTKSDSPTETDSPVAIVAVHGLGAHPDDAWCKKLDTGDGEVRYFNWLSEPSMLPAVVPRARIMRYGYDSRWFGQDAVKTKTSDISQLFLLDLKFFREEDQNRPLILIAHGFGGLVVLGYAHLVHHRGAHPSRRWWMHGSNDIAGREYTTRLSALSFLGSPFEEPIMHSPKLRWSGAPLSCLRKAQCMERISIFFGREGSP